MRKTSIFFFLILLLAACWQDKSKQATTDAAIAETAKEARLFGLPLTSF